LERILSGEEVEEVPFTKQLMDAFLVVEDILTVGALFAGGMGLMVIAGFSIFLGTIFKEQAPMFLSLAGISFLGSVSSYGLSAHKFSSLLQGILPKREEIEILLDSLFPKKEIEEQPGEEEGRLPERQLPWQEETEEVIRRGVTTEPDGTVRVDDKVVRMTGMNEKKLAEDIEDITPESDSCSIGGSIHCRNGDEESVEGAIGRIVRKRMLWGIGGLSAIGGLAFILFMAFAGEEQVIVYDTEENETVAIEEPVIIEEIPVKAITKPEIEPVKEPEQKEEVEPPEEEPKEKEEVEPLEEQEPTNPLKKYGATDEEFEFLQKKTREFMDNYKIGDFDDNFVEFYKEIGEELKWPSPLHKIVDHAYGQIAPFIFEKELSSINDKNLNDQMETCLKLSDKIINKRFYLLTYEEKVAMFEKLKAQTQARINFWIDMWRTGLFGTITEYRALGLGKDKDSDKITDLFLNLARKGLISRTDYEQAVDIIDQISYEYHKEKIK